jgi:AcrR family transcriptional regulator
MPKAFTEHEKELIGKRLLDQGYKQFSAHGLKKTSIEEIAKAAGISKGAFYIFYKSKEALFMDIAEQAEEHFRQEVLAAIDLPGPSPRARLLAVLNKVFPLWKTIPLLQFFTRGDFDLLLRRIPEEVLREHLANDQKFMGELIARCRQAGIPIQVTVEQFFSLMYDLLIVSLHEDDLVPGYSSGAYDQLMELTAAYFLGEISTQSQDKPVKDSSSEKDH